MSYQKKILSINSSSELNKEYIIYKNNSYENDDINKLKNKLKDKIEELNNKIDFISNYNLYLDTDIHNNISNSINTIENTITSIDRFIISKGNIRTLKLID